MSKKDYPTNALSMLPAALGLTNEQFAADVLRISAAQWVNYKKGVHPLQVGMEEKILASVRAKVSSFHFEIEHLDLPPKDFAALFEGENTYGNVLGLLPPEHRPKPKPGKIGRFRGCFIRFYSSRDVHLKDESKAGIGFDVFRISTKENNRFEADVKQLTSFFGDASGIIRIDNDIVELILNHTQDDDPDHYCLAPLPRSEKPFAWLATSLDIIFPERRVVTRTVLFVRVDDNEKLPTRSNCFGENTTFYDALRPVLESATHFNPITLQMHLVATQLEDPVQERAIREAMKAFWRELPLLEEVVLEDSEGSR
jgi:hypothetical protein